MRSIWITLLMVLIPVLILAQEDSENLTPPHADPDNQIEAPDSLLDSQILERYKNPDMGQSIEPKMIKKASKKSGSCKVNPIKMLADCLFKLYSRFITSQDDQKCQFDPSCSAYAREAFQCKDPVSAALITSDRLMRCNPMAGNYYHKNEEGLLVDTLEGACDE